MGLNLKLIQRVSKGQSASELSHSSGYASAQNNGGFGASGGSSFSERQQIEQRRKMIRGYSSARVAQQVNRTERAKDYETQQAEQQAIDEKNTSVRRAQASMREPAANSAFSRRLDERHGFGMSTWKEEMRGNYGVKPQQSGRPASTPVMPHRDSTTPAAAPGKAIPRSSGFGRH